MSVKTSLFFAAAASLFCLIFVPSEAAAQSRYEPPTKFSRQFKIEKKSDDLLSNNADTPREARNDRRKRRAQARKNNRQQETFNENRTASQEELGQEKRIGRRERQSRNSRDRQRARNAAPSAKTSGGLND